MRVGVSSPMRDHDRVEGNVPCSQPVRTAIIELGSAILVTMLRCLFGSFAIVTGMLCLSSCGSQHSVVGLVTQVRPLCVGEPKAAGQCYSVPSTLHVLYQAGECVKVSYKTGSGARQELVSLTHVAAASHERACPP